MKLTKREQASMRQVKNGADVWDYGIASDLRAVQRKAPSLISIGKPMMYRGTGVDRMPYFGAILTPAGRRALKSLPPEPPHGR